MNSITAPKVNNDYGLGLEAVEAMVNKITGELQDLIESPAITMDVEAPLDAMLAMKRLLDVAAKAEEKLEDAVSDLRGAIEAGNAGERWPRHVKMPPLNK